MLAPWPRTVGSTAKRLRLVAGPTAEPISFDMEKTSIRISFNSNSYIVKQRIATSRGMSEKHIRRCLVQQIWDMFLDDEAYVIPQPSYFPWATTGLYAPNQGLPEITLPMPPTQSVMGIWTTDDTGTETLVDPSVYYVTKSNEPCRIRLNAGYFWPPHRGGEGFRIRFSCGYATPFSVSSDGSTVLASNHGYNNNDYVRFTSLDGTLPNPLEIGQNYLVSSLTPSGFAVTQLDGTAITLEADWDGTGFIGEVPAAINQAIIMIAALNQASEVPSRIPGAAGSSRLSPIEIPVEPAEMLAPYVWPWL